MPKNDNITYIEEANVYQCNDCGAHAPAGEPIKHHSSCQKGESKKWEKFYEENQE